nr:AprI/Inh family metalloprotease inhibitor [uncultured Cohaesibacter sp.]
MAKYASLSALMMTCAIALGGCAVSGGGDLVKSEQVRSSIPLEASQLPPIVDAAEATPTQTAKAEKFNQRDDQILTIASADSAFEDKSSEIQQAYADAVGDQAQITTERTSLKPFVGRWTLDSGARKAKAKVQQIGALFGKTEQCELVLEDSTSGSGFKAYGNSSCPTSLFMLDSWTAFGKKLVLRDHMGDEIVSLRSRGTDKWIGVDQRGETLVLTKS